MTEYIEYHGVGDPLENLDKPGIYRWNGAYSLVIEGANWYMMSDNGVELPISGKKPKQSASQSQGTADDTLLKAIAIAQNPNIAVSLFVDQGDK